MSADQLLIALMALFAVLGALDRIFGGRFGIGREFESGILTMGSLALAMVGIVCLAPVLAAVLQQYYLERGALPSEILLPEPVEDMETLAALLTGRAGHRVTLRVPQRGERAGVRQKKIHIQIEHLHRPHPLTAFLGIISSFRPTGKRLRRHVQLLLAQPVSHEALRHLADDDGFRHQHVGRHIRRLRPRRNDDADAGR